MSAEEAGMLAGKRPAEFHSKDGHFRPRSKPRSATRIDKRLISHTPPRTPPPTPRYQSHNPNSWPTNVTPDFGQRAFWLPKDWSQGVKITKTGKRQKVWLSPEGRAFYRKVDIEKCLGREVGGGYYQRKRGPLGRQRRRQAEQSRLRDPKARAKAGGRRAMRTGRVEWPHWLPPDWDVGQHYCAGSLRRCFFTPEGKPVFNRTQIENHVKAQAEARTKRQKSQPPTVDVEEDDDELEEEGEEEEGIGDEEEEEECQEEDTEEYPEGEEVVDAEAEGNLDMEGEEEEEEYAEGEEEEEEFTGEEEEYVGEGEEEEPVDEEDEEDVESDVYGVRNGDEEPLPDDEAARSAVASLQASAIAAAAAVAAASHVAAALATSHGKPQRTEASVNGRKQPQTLRAGSPANLGTHRSATPARVPRGRS